ncbi:MAG: hypothetical protein WDO68_32090 [Gammaproteobacteria bacterium]
MSSRKNPTSRSSRGSLPPLAFDVRPCRRAQFAWTLFALLAGVGLCLGFTAYPAWRVIALAVALALGWLPGLAVLGSMGPLAVRHFEWAPDGEWHLTRADGRCETGRLAGATATVGPWILLVWTAGSRPWRPFSRRYALIGVSEVGLVAFRTLKGRLCLLGGRHSGRSGPDPRPAAP